MSAGAVQWGLPALEPWAERPDPERHWLDGIEHLLLAPPRLLSRRWGQLRLRRMVASVNRLEPELTVLSDGQLTARAADLRKVMCLRGFDAPLVIEVAAIVREVSRRTTGLRHHDVQLLAGLSMLNGMVAEMDTGEGKTLTAALTACAAVFAGMPVHVVTVNDYLANRDCKLLSPIYSFLGISVGVAGTDLTPAQRVAVYSRDIAYASNTAIAFDYLRDRIALGRQPSMLANKLRRFSGYQDAAQPVMRGLHFAIVDEADSVLVDEARTPLIISHETDAGQEREWAEHVFQLADGLLPDTHFQLKREERRIVLTDAGRSLLAERGEALGGIWLNPIRREEGVRQGLTAMRLFKRGEQYLVQDGKVQIIDEYSGRIMPDRSWSDGLHQLVEFKEGCRVTSRKLTIARMTYQRFFRRYIRLAGMTGTAREVRDELWSVYRLDVARIPSNRPSRRTHLGTTVCATQDEKWHSIVERVRFLEADGRSVLIGTRSVLASVTLSNLLEAAGIAHTVLNAEHIAEESEIIAEAGRQGHVTVATNMAGRGVDIAVDPGVLERGGLHVILSELHDAGRIDRQMQGRTARRGEPGSTEAILSLEDPLLDLAPGLLTKWIAAQRLGGLTRLCRHRLFELSQRRAERAHARERKNLLSQDRRLGVLLAFSGKTE